MINPILGPKQSIARVAVNDAPVSLVIMYIGAQASATITVSTDITFKHGVAGAEVVDPSIDSGGDDEGVIDISDSNADTLGGVVDLINASANWKAFIRDGIRADTSAGLLARSESTLVPNVTETPLYSDTSTDLRISLRIGSRESVNGREENSAAELFKITSTNTFASGTNLIQVYIVDEAKKTEEKVYEESGAATTVEDVINFVSDARGSIATKKTGQHLVVRMIGSAACSGKLAAVGAVARGA